MFSSKRFLTKGVCENVNLLLQIFMWQCIDSLHEPKDYLQIFSLSKEDGKQKIIHTQEVPAYRREYLIDSGAPFFVGKIYVIDDGIYSTMLLSSEY